MHDEMTGRSGIIKTTFLAEQAGRTPTRVLDMFAFETYEDYPRNVVSVLEFFQEYGVEVIFVHQWLERGTSLLQYVEYMMCV